MREDEAKQCHPDTTGPLPYERTVAVTVSQDLHKIKTINILAWRKKGDHEPLPLKICRVDASKGGKSAFIKSTAPVG